MLALRFEALASQASGFMKT